jgi:EamA domain-containing membrane protein RarD
MREHVKPLGLTALILLALALLGGLFTPTSALTMLSLALGFFLYFILPGYSALLLLKLDNLERVLLAVPASAVLVPVSLYFVNIVGLPLSRNVVLAVIALITAVSLALFLRARNKSRSSAQ